MTTFVKKFIEYNIDHINNKDWNVVITNWYFAAEDDPFNYNDALFDELTSTMYKAGIQFLTESADARESFLRTRIEMAVDEFENSTYDFDYTKEYMTQGFASWLGFDSEELEDMIDDVARQHDVYIP